MRPLVVIHAILCWPIWLLLFLATDFAIGLPKSQSSTAAADSLYMIGNSLTDDANPLLVSEIAAQTGVTLQVGKHTRSGSSLKTNWDLPDGFSSTLDPFGNYESSLPHYDWDFLTFQPHNGQSATQNEDFEMIGNFVNFAQSEGRNTDTQIYVYAGWPERFNLDNWPGGIGVGPEEIMRYTNYYFDTLMQRLTIEYGDRAKLIPVGHVIEEIRLAADADLLPGFSSATELFRDLRHMNFLGTYVAATTVHATLYGESPVGKQPTPLAQIDSRDPDLVAALQQIIWNVVTRNPHTGVVGKPAGDFDQDGDVDAADYTVWRDNAFQFSTVADANSDGFVDQLDYQLWKQFYTGSLDHIPGTAQAGVPEPATIASLMLALVCRGVTRRPTGR